MNHDQLTTATPAPTAPTATTAVAVRGNMTALDICGRTKELTTLGQMLAQSGFFGRVSTSTATAALVNCFMEGLTPLQFKAKYHIFEDGQTSIRSDYYQREFQRLGGDWEFVKWDATECDMRFSFRGRVFPLRVTLDEFKENGVALGKDGKTLKTNWSKFPREMLKARCMATAIRSICPQAMEGQYTQEEVADFATAAPAPAPVAAKVEAVSPSPLAPEPAQIDYGVCPCGSVKGKPWAEIPNEKLEQILASSAKAVTPEHKNAIVAELGRREAEANGEAIDAEVVED